MSSHWKWFFAALRPRYYYQQNPYSPKWDAILNRLLDEEHFTCISQHHATIGPYRVWIENHPYNSFHPVETQPKVRPRRRTIARAWDQLLNDAFEEK